MADIEVQEFFNSLAEKWDRICFHDPKKLDMMISLLNINQNNKILDIACGTGVLEEYLIKYQPSRIVAVDFAEKMILEANRKYSDDRIDFICKDVYDLTEDQFDRIIIYSAYPHFDDKQMLFEFCYNKLKPNGRLMICHSESKESINAHHTKTASDVSNMLPSGFELANLMKPYFSTDIVIDTEQLYIVSGKKIEKY